MNQKELTHMTTQPALPLPTTRPCRHCRHGDPTTPGSSRTLWLCPPCFTKWTATQGDR